MIKQLSKTFLSFTKKFANKYLGGNYWSSNTGHIYHDDILEFDPLTGQWKQVGRMRRGRVNHAVSVIDFQPGMCVKN